MKIGLYGGSFNPIHHGHLILARDALEQLGLDKVIFIPGRDTTLIKKSPIDFRMTRRLHIHLLKTALKEEPQLELDSSELERESQPYAIDTVQRVQDNYPEAKIFYFVGDDHLASLPTWKGYSILCQKIQFIVFSRGNLPLTGIKFPVIRRRLDISSSEIRARINQGHSVRFLLPESVRKAILSSFDGDGEIDEKKSRT